MGSSIESGSLFGMVTVMWAFAVLSAAYMLSIVNVIPVNIWR